MKSISECYKILGISPTNDKERIRSAFRQKALSVHPDIHGVSSDSSLDFILLRNAYEALMVFATRWSSAQIEHASRKKEAQASETPGPKRESKSEAPGRKFVQQLNWLIWDIEDLFRNQRKENNKVYSDQMVNRDILITLVMIDKDILMEAGIHDNFMTARKLPPLDPERYIDVFTSGVSISRHFPYTSVENYFFDIRMRMNRLLDLIDRSSIELQELWNGRQSLEKSMRTYQNCVYNISKIGECLKDDKLYLNDFLEVRELALRE